MFPEICKQTFANFGLSLLFLDEAYTNLRSNGQFRNSEPEARQAGRYGKGSFQIDTTPTQLGIIPTTS